MLANKPEFIGLDTKYLNARGESLTRLHLDGAASPLAMKEATQAIQDLLPHYSNTHSTIHHSARIASQAFNWATQQVLQFAGADSNDYSAVFMGAGTTAIVNRIARGLHDIRREKKVVLVSAMEHHANDLPHRQFDNEVHYIPLQGSGAEQGAIDLLELERLLQLHADSVNYIALSAVSNVTGIVNPVDNICALAHQYGVLVVVDAAQAAAHLELDLSSKPAEQQADFVVFSGHKLYCPTAPGVLIAKSDLLVQMPGQDLGGGAVDDVSYYDFQLSSLPNREQAGTPNIVGAIALAKVLARLEECGLKAIEQHSINLINELHDALSSLPHIKVYGEPKTKRAGALSFTHDGIDHGLLAAILNDYYGIAVRNQCFCAHPYVSSLLKEALWEIDLSTIEEEQQEAFINRKRGMVRVSLSLYNNSNDIERLIRALQEINAQIDGFRELYRAKDNGDYVHQSYTLDWRSELGW